MTLAVRNAGGQISRYGSQLGTTPRNVETSFNSEPQSFSSASHETRSA